MIRCLPILILVYTIVLTSCATQSMSSKSPGPQQQPQPGTPSTPLSSCPTKGWCPSYETFLQAQFSPSVLATDQSSVCRQRLDPKRFWTGFVKAIVYCESGYDAASGMTEDFKDGATGVLARSVGLLQLSVGDKLNYKTPYCQRLTPETLKNPEINLGCGLEIMSTLVTRDKTLLGGSDPHWLGLARYWSVVRPGHCARSRVYVELPECK